MELVKVSDLFTVHYGSNLELNAISHCECKKTPCARHPIPFVSRTGLNNGVSAYVSEQPNIKKNPAHTLSVAGGGAVMSTFYQEQEYYSGRDLYYLAPKADLSKKQMVYYAICLKHNAYRFSYGRQANKTLRDLLIPALHTIPDWVENTKISTISKTPVHDTPLTLNTDTWSDFYLKDLFDIKGTKSHTKESIQYHNKGTYPFITTTSMNNGAEGFYDYYTEKGNVLTIDSATIGSCFYQKDNFTASDHVEKLIPRFHMNTYVALFLKTIIECEKFRYGYGRKFAQKRIKNTKIKLPTDSNGDLDWQFMENYIKSLPYSRGL